MAFRHDRRPVRIGPDPPPAKQEPLRTAVPLRPLPGP